ncbi:MAG: hypothetical protein AB3N10_10195 [Allomuricauda sp.]
MTEQYQGRWVKISNSDEEDIFERLKGTDIIEALELLQKELKRTEWIIEGDKVFVINPMTQEKSQLSKGFLETNYNYAEFLAHTEFLGNHVIRIEVRGDQLFAYYFPKFDPSLEFIRAEMIVSEQVAGGDATR